MAITKPDIKMMASQDLSDNDQGGGLMTGTEIVDGNVNNLFPDISRLDRTVGRVSLRKAFLAILTTNQDIYYGSHSILTDPPDDPSVSVVIFSTDSYTDQRKDAQNHIESYVVRGVLSRLRLYDNQLEGQKTILAVTPVDNELPEIGQVYNLVEDEGLGSEFEQYVRVTSVDHEVQSFNDGSGSYDMRVITVGISDPLRYTFHGGAPARLDTTAQSTDQAVMRKTTVADASQYFGVTGLVADIAVDDLTFTVDSIYAYLVPSSQSETPLADIQAGGDTGRLVPAATDTVNLVDNTSGQSVFYLGSGIDPQSLSISGGGSVWVDDGKGGLVRQSGTDTTEWRVVSYDAGHVVIDSTDFQASVTFTWKPAVKITDVSDTDKIDITIQNRGLTYVKTLNPIPAPGSLVIDYMSLGVWYRLRDQGDGTIAGDQPNTGVGSINFGTGTVTLTLAALPDADTAILFGWGGNQHYQVRDTSAEIPNMLIEKTLANPVFPGSLSISWLAGGVTKTATDDGKGNLTGDGTGAVQYGTGKFYLSPKLMIDPNSSLTVDYTKDTQYTDSIQVDDVGGDISLTLTNTPLKPGSVEVIYTVQSQTQYYEYLDNEFYQVDGQGDLAIRSFYVEPGTYNQATNETDLTRHAFDDGLGGFDDPGDTINYTNGQVTLKVQLNNSNTGREYDPTKSNKSWSQTVVNEEFAQQYVTIKYHKSDGSPTAEQEIFTVPPLQLDLLPTVTDKVIAGSVRFVLNNETYVDRSGNIYKNIDPETNAGTLAGTIDYASGIVTLTNWTGGASRAVTIEALLSQFGDWSNYEAYFRTSGSPLKPMSFFVSANKVSDGTLMSDTADANGALTTADLEGQVNVENGVVTVKFGRWQVAAGNENEPWYDPAELDGQGNVWQPEYVVPNTMKYNAVVFAYLPIDANLIGIDPVRLPEDGRVPIFRPGNVIVIHNTQAENMPNPLSADQTVNLTGTNYSLIELYDQDDAQVDPNLYTVDLVNGAVTMTNPLDLSAYTQPLIAYKRIEDMLLVSDVQINGQITVTSQIKHAYTAGQTYISSALIHGDMGSRIYGLFEQETWTSVWSDTLIGNATTAQYNEAGFPIQVTNDGAIEERWALIFTSATTFDIVGENIGVIGNGITNGAGGTFTEPTNPATGQPYFRIQQDGWGSGWSTGNVVRFNTESANSPIWFARVTLPGPEVEPTDQFTIQNRGDAN